MFKIKQSRIRYECLVTLKRLTTAGLEMGHLTDVAVATCLCDQTKSTMPKQLPNLFLRIDVCSSNFERIRWLTIYSPKADVLGRLK